MSSKKNKSKPVWDIFDIVEIFIICTSIIVLIFSLFVRLTVVDGDSMTNTLQNGEYLLVRDVLYTPERGDIVVVHDISKNTVSSMYANPLVKRVIGIGGDTVEIKNGVVYVNGEAQQEDYIRETMYPDNMSAVKLGEHEVFVMGDNRNHSGDSRIIGPIDERCIIGKAFLRVFPFNQISFIQDPER